jgi:NAD(P)-dependent dehydrogenase (short-subunit alcohol dehydrogenase family)
MTNDLDGKVILLTGATEGIGKAAAREFAGRGATLTLVARNQEKGERLVSELTRESGNQRIELLRGDLSSQEEIRAVAKAFREKHSHLHVLANNAGAVFAKRVLSKDGFEMTFALNHLAYFLLTHELLDSLKGTPGARIVNTASDAHNNGRIDLATIATRPNKKAGMRAYSDSKLANILFTRELARRLSDTNVTANCFHPGFIKSGFGANNPGLFGGSIQILSSLFGRTPERGAETLVFLATSAAAASFSGEYFYQCKVGKISASARDEALAKELWALSERLCNVS